MPSWPFSRRKAAPLVASAAGQPIGDRKAAEKQRRLRQAWQGEAWAYYDAIGEIRYPVEFMANAVTRMRVYPAWIDNPDEPPVPLDEADGVPAQLVAAAHQDLAALGTGQQGLRPLLHDHYVNNKIAGEMWLVGDTDPDTDLERWRVRSVDEVIIDDSGNAFVRDDPHAQSITDWTRLDDADSYLCRLWRPHPRFEALATSPMRAILDSCEELLILSRSIRGTARSRLAGAGLLLIAQELSMVGVNPTDDDPESDPFFEELTKAMITPISDESDASAVVPVVARVPGEMLKEGKAAQLIRFDRTFDAEAMKLREELIGRIATGLDLPKEVVTGVVDLNHWTAWQVDDNTFRHHIEPDVITQVDDLTTGYMRPFLAARGVWDPQVIGRVCYWYDPVELVTHPDRTQDAMALHDKLVISNKALAKVAGFGEDEVPDANELLLRMFQHSRTFPPNVVEGLIHRIDPTLVIPADKNEPGETPAGPTPPDATQPPPQGDGSPGGPPNGPQPPRGGAGPTTAAAAPGDTDLPLDEVQRRGVMVAFYPTPEQAQQLAVDGGEPVEDLHCTLAYLGHAEDLTDEQVQTIHDVCQQVADSHAALDGEFGGIGRFTADGSPDGDPVYASVDVPGLAALRTRIVEALTDAGVPAASDHGFTPHTTLAYIPSDAELPAHRLDPVPATFAALSVVVGPDRTDYAMTGTKTLVAAVPARRVHAHASRQLVDIDRQLRARLLQACDAAVRRQLERAGARLRSRAQKDATLRAAMATVPQDRIAATIGRTQVAALGVDDHELVGTDWSDLHGQWTTLVARAQKQARKAAAQIVGIGDDDPALDELAARQTAASDAGWAALAAGLSSLVLARLYDPHPDAPAQGEYDANLTVPASLIREAMATAGRDPELTDDGGAAVLTLPAGAWGIGQGDAVQSFLEDNGAQRESYTWLHGDTDRPLDAHLALDGVEFTDWDDPRLTNNDSFPEVEVLAPGDHAGCTCDAWITWATSSSEIPEAA